MRGLLGLEMITMDKSIYSFETLRDIFDYFTYENSVPFDEVKIGGAWGGLQPTEDDEPVFIWGD